jgi:predicted NBD/HSP70 family sugar kinase
MRPSSEQDAFEPIVRGVAQSGVRVANERAVLALIAGIPGASNADIARRSGLGPQTTARILAELEARDLVIRGEVLRGRRGQPATPYRLNPEGAYSIGLEIGWSHFELLLHDFAGGTTKVQRHPRVFDTTPAETLAAVVAKVAELVESLSNRQRERLVGIGLALPILSPALLEQLKVDPLIIQAWMGFDLRALLAEQVDLPTTHIESGSAAGWLEMLEMTPPRPPSVVTIFIGALLGGGLVVNGNLYEGPRGIAGDLGAMPVCGPDGTPTPLHLLVSVLALRRWLAQAGHDPGNLPTDQWDWATIEPVIGPWIELSARALAQALVSISALADSDVAIVNGDLPQTVLTRLRSRLEQYLHSSGAVVFRLPAIAAGKAGTSAPALGAARLVLFQSHFSRAWGLFEGDLGK